MGAQGRGRLSGVGRGASVSLTADRRKQLSGMDAAQIDGHRLWREFLGASPIDSILDEPFPGSGCPALSASGPPPIGRTGAAVGCELFVGLDRPITTAVATAPRQAYGPTLNSRLHAHGSEGRAETTLGRNREPNRGIGHWLASRSQ